MLAAKTCSNHAGRQAVPELLSDFFPAAGMRPADLEVLNVTKLLQVAVQPSAQIQELQQALASLTGSPAQSQVVQQLGTQVVNGLAARQSARVGVSIDRLFPVFSLIQSVSGQSPSSPPRTVSI